MSANARTADACVCAGTSGHAIIADRVVWCKACGCVRNVYQDKWFVPQAQVGKLAGKVEEGDDGPKTEPGTPKAKSGEWPKAGT